MKKPYLCLLVAIVIGLSGCTTSSGASSVASAVYNHHSLKKSVNDQIISMRAFQLLRHEKDLASANIVVSTFNKDVLLVGQAPDMAQKIKAEKLIRSIPDIGDVYNLVSIESPSPSLTKISDAWITTKIKSKLMASDDLDASAIKVVTEDSTVYLLGTISNDEADIAAQLASETQGVKNVVKIFSYVSIQKHTLPPLVTAENTSLPLGDAEQSLSPLTNSDPEPTTTGG